MPGASSISRIQRSLGRWLCAFCLSTALILGSGVAFANPEPAAVSAAAPVERVSPARAYDDWHATQHWRYGTDSLFALSRGLSHEPIPMAGRVLLYLVTVPLDVAQLPAAVLAGFWGD